MLKKIAYHIITEQKSIPIPAAHPCTANYRKLLPRDPCKPPFYFIKVGCKGVFVSRTYFCDDVNFSIICDISDFAKYRRYHTFILFVVLHSGQMVDYIFQPDEKTRSLTNPEPLRLILPRLSAPRIHMLCKNDLL